MGKLDTVPWDEYPLFTEPLPFHPIDPLHTCEPPSVLDAQAHPDFFQSFGIDLPHGLWAEIMPIKILDVALLVTLM